MNTVKFWLEPALDLGQGIHQSFGHNCRSVNVILRFPCIQWEREKKFLSVPTVYKGNAKQSLQSLHNCFNLTVHNLKPRIPIQFPIRGRPPFPFVTQNPTNPYIFERLRNKSLTPLKSYILYGRRPLIWGYKPLFCRTLLRIYAENYSVDFSIQKTVMLKNIYHSNGKLQIFTINHQGICLGFLSSS